MEFSTEQSELLHYLQDVEFKRQAADEPSKLADCLHSSVQNIGYARASNMISPACASLLLGKQLEKQAVLVDSPLEQQGLNNYAEGALALCSKYKNESSEWKSSLCGKNLLELDCVKRLTLISKLRAQQLNPHGTNSTIIPGYKPNNFSTVTPPPGPKSQVKDANQKQWSNQTAAIFRPSSTNNGVPNQNGRTGNTGNFYGRQQSVNDGNTVPTMGRGRGGERGGERGGSFGGYSGDSRSTSHRQPFPSNPDVVSAVSSRIFGSVGGGQSNHQPSTSTYQFKRNEPNKRSFQQVDGEEEDNSRGGGGGGAFRTAKEQLAIDNQKKFGRGRGGGGGHQSGQVSTSAYGTSKKSLGPRRGPRGGFVPPILNKEDGDTNDDGRGSRAGPSKGGSSGGDEPVDERLKNIEPKMVELIMSEVSIPTQEGVADIMNEIMDHGAPVSWDDIAGLEFAKKTIKEIVVWPMLRPDIFTGLRGPPKGLLLFGPPGTGKTLIGKCIAVQSKSTFFSISASSLTSKWVGEGEKMVRALFAVARCEQPAVIFIDEIDSLLSQRSDGEHEASRRIKTEFLVQLDGATTGNEERILVVGATNRPQELDEAARRRFVKRLYIPLPEGHARGQIILNLLQQQTYHLADNEMEDIIKRTDGYSGADMANLCREAALGPIRSISMADIENITADQVRPMIYSDFEDALMQVRASVSPKDLDLFLDWNNTFGSGGR